MARLAHLEDFLTVVAGTSLTAAEVTFVQGANALANSAAGEFLRKSGGALVNATPSTGITSLNTLTGATQTFAVGTTGSDFAISSATTVHTFNIPDAGASARGLVTTGTQTFAGAKTFSGHLTVEGVTSTGATGTGKFVFDGTPTLVTPVLGTPTSGTLTNCTGLPVAGLSNLGTGVGTFLITPSSANLASALTDETGSGALVFGTTPTIATPVLNGLPTGTGVASAATASTLMSRDANANTNINNLLEGYTTTVTAAGTKTLAIGDTYMQFFTGSTTHTVTLPVASTLSLGHSFLIVNSSTGAVTVNSSGANAVIVLAGGTSAVVTCILASGTTAASWNATYYADVVTSAKKLSVSNSLTLAGTDGKSLTLTNGLTVTTNDGTLAFGAASKTLTVNKSLTLDGTDSTTMTFPSTSATIARTDAGQTFTGTQVMTSPKILTSILDTNGNTELSMIATASAVNYVEITNAATGTAGAIIAAQGETNIDLKIAAKGTGKIHETTGRYGDITAYTPTGGATSTLTLNTSNIHSITMPAGNITIAVSNSGVGQVFMVRILQDGVGSRTVTWFTTIKWAGGSAPTLTTTASKADMFGFLVTSAGNYDGFVVGQNL